MVFDYVEIRVGLGVRTVSSSPNAPRRTDLGTGVFVARLQSAREFAWKICGCCLPLSGEIATDRASCRLLSALIATEGIRRGRYRSCFFVFLRLTSQSPAAIHRLPGGNLSIFLASCDLTASWEPPILPVPAELLEKSV